MYDHNISGMVERLVSSGVVAEEKAQVAHDALSNYWMGRIALVWQADDVRCVIADKLKVKLEDIFLSDLEADEILQTVLDNHNCSIGVTWEHITWATQEALGESLQFYAMRPEFVKLSCTDSPWQYYTVPNIPELIETVKSWLVEPEDFEQTFKLEPAPEATWRDVDQEVLQELKLLNQKSKLLGKESADAAFKQS